MLPYAAVCGWSSPAYASATGVAGREQCERCGRWRQGWSKEACWGREAGGEGWTDRGAGGASVAGMLTYADVCQRMLTYAEGVGETGALAGKLHRYDFGARAR